MIQSSQARAHLEWNMREPQDNEKRRPVVSKGLSGPKHFPICDSHVPCQDTVFVIRHRGFRHSISGVFRNFDRHCSRVRTLGAIDLFRSSQTSFLFVVVSVNSTDNFFWVVIFFLPPEY